MLLGTPRSWFDGDGWIRFEDPNGRFEVRFPGRPTETQAKTPRGEIHRSAESRLPDGTSFVAMYADLPPRSIPVAEFFDDISERLAKAAGGTRRTWAIHNGRLQGYPAREFEFDRKDGRVTAGAVFLVGDRFYYLSVTGSGIMLESRVVRRFFDSFQFTPGPEVAPEKDKDKAR